METEPGVLSQYSTPSARLEPPLSIYKSVPVTTFSDGASDDRVLHSSASDQRLLLPTATSRS